MRNIAKFYKVSWENFAAAYRALCPGAAEALVRAAYDELSLPKRATRASAGYDFYTPLALTLAPGENVKIPTGIRAQMNEDYVLMIFPRSGLGFKYRLQLNNTVGIIDADYFEADNEGHIFIKLTNDSREGKTLKLSAGDAFAQGIFLPFGLTVDDACETKRTGGLGSTGGVR